MSHEFKPGDRVVCVDNDSCSLSLQMGKEYVVREVFGDWVNLEGDSKLYFYWRFSLATVDRIEAAKELLIKEGYTVTPPKPKQKGQLVVFTIDGSSIRTPIAMSKDDWDGHSRRFSNWRSGRTILAIVDWEEGQGLDNNQNT